MQHTARNWQSADDQWIVPSDCGASSILSSRILLGCNGFGYDIFFDRQYDFRVLLISGTTACHCSTLRWSAVITNGSVPDCTAARMLILFAVLHIPRQLGLYICSTWAAHFTQFQLTNT